MAAVKACGEGAVLCGFAAANLQGLIRGQPPPPQVMTRNDRQIDGVLTSRCRRLDRRDVMIWNGIPCTTVPRTLVDLAAELEPRALNRAYHEAAVTRGTTPEQVERVLARRRNARGATKLRAVLHGDEALLLSKLEEGFFDRFRPSGLPLPTTNRRTGNHHVDLRWPGLTVELVSYVHLGRRLRDVAANRARAA